MLVVRSGHDRDVGRRVEALYALRKLGGHLRVSLTSDRPGRKVSVTAAARLRQRAL
jgi:hypothetical protein